MFMFDRKQLLVGAAIILLLELVTTVVRASAF
jgi:hypothetical protein